jgi:tetratricopeptide (TPR) repeat protein
VVARIDSVILFIEGQQREGKPLDADNLVLKAIPLMYSMERDRYETAGRLIADALRADDSNANLLAWAAFWQVWYVGQGWAADPAQALAIAQDRAVRAIRLDPQNAEATGIYGHICAFLNKDFEAAMHYFDCALRLNPNLAFIWALSAPTCCYVGQPDLALTRLDRYRELAPADPMFPLWEYFYAIAYFFKHDYEQAVAIGRRAAKANPDFVNGYKPLIAALGHLGRLDEAAPYIDKLLRLEPNFTVTSFGRVYPFLKEADRDHYMQGLLLAGVPRS